MNECSRLNHAKFPTFYGAALFGAAAVSPYGGAQVVYNLKLQEGVAQLCAAQKARTTDSISDRLGDFFAYVGAKAYARTAAANYLLSVGLPFPLLGFPGVLSDMVSLGFTYSDGVQKGILRPLFGGAEAATAHSQRG